MANWFTRELSALFGHRYSNNNNALVGDSNIYNPEAAYQGPFKPGQTPNTKPVGNTVSNYFSGKNQPVAAYNGKLYDPKGSFGYPYGAGGAAATSAPTPTDPATAGAAGGAAGAAAPQQNLVEYPSGSGFYYDLNSDQERQSFYNRRLSDLVSSRDQQLGQIDQQIGDLTGQAKDYVTNYFNQLGSLGNTKSAGDIARSSSYAAASPNAFQSSEYDSANLANNNYLKAVGDTASQAQTDVGANFLANPNDVSQLNPDTTFGRQLANYNQGRNAIGTQYNDYLAGITQQNNPAANPFRFDYQAAGLQTPKAVDTSGYNPFVDFRSIPSTAMPGGTFHPSGSLAFNGDTNISPFLGKNSFNQKDQDYLKNYLLGKSS